MPVANNSPMWSNYNPKHITKMSLYDFLSKNPAVFQRPGSTFDPSNGGQNTLSGGVEDIRASLGGDASPEYKKQFAQQIVGDDPNKYFNDNNLSGNYRYDPATGMVETYYDPANQGDDFLKVLGTFAALAGGAGALNGAFGGAASGGALEGAGAFGGEAFGAAANSAGAFGGSVGPWTAGAGATAAGGGMENWFDSLIENYNPDLGFEGLNEAGAFNTPSGIDWTNIDSMIEKLGTAAGEAENLVTAQSIAQQAGLSVSQAKTLLDTTKSLGSSALKAMGGLKGLIPAALAAGLFENNTNPLTGNVTEASNKALSSAGAFAGMDSVGMQPSWQKAIQLANSSAGAWKPYVDQAATYTNQAAGGLPSIDLSQYMNPYIDSVLTPQLRNINEAADKERMRLAYLAKISGNDTYATPGSGSATRYGVEEGTLNDNRFKQIGDATGLAYKGAFDTATGLATSDLNRKMTAGGAFNTLANTVGNQTGGDITRLAGAGDLEAKPQENALTHKADTTKLYTSIIPGTTSAITATNKPSVLGQAVGAFGSYNAANKAGWFD